MIINLLDRGETRDLREQREEAKSLRMKYVGDYLHLVSIK